MNIFPIISTKEQNKSLTYQTATLTRQNSSEIQHPQKSILYYDSPQVKNNIIWDQNNRPTHLQDKPIKGIHILAI